MLRTMLRNVRSLALASAIGLFMMAAPDRAHAEWAPSGPIEMLIGFAEGGGADALARLVANHIQDNLGWQIVPRNRGGAGGAVMAELLRNARPDGQVIGMGTTTTFSNNPFLVPGLDYAPEDFDYLGTIALSQMVIVAPADAPFDTLDEMAEHARSVGGLTIGSMGANLQMIAEMISRHYDIQLFVVPSTGGGAVLTQLLGGHIDLGFNGGAHHQYIRSGDMKVIVNLNEQPLMLTPDVGNLRDAGIDYSTYIYFQFQAPAGLPDDVRAALASAIDAAVNSDAVRELAEQRMEMQLVNIGPEQLTEVIANDAAAFRDLPRQD
jgi:tripartite-type tricarboxylate transporter receptor subunit TctC